MSKKSSIVKCCHCKLDINSKSENYTAIFEKGKLARASHCECWLKEIREGLKEALINFIDQEFQI